jgi:hypothetical protein
MDYYVLQSWAGANFVKEADFFVSQGGLRDSWGQHWLKVEADSINDARRKCEELFNGYGDLRGGDVCSFKDIGFKCRRQVGHDGNHLEHSRWGTMSRPGNTATS